MGDSRTDIECSYVSNQIHMMPRLSVFCRVSSLVWYLGRFRLGPLDVPIQDWYNQLNERLTSIRLLEQANDREDEDLHNARQQ
jgi:hypothetical protein